MEIGEFDSVAARQSRANQEAIKAEHLAEERIQRASKRVMEAEAESAKELDKIRDRFDRQQSEEIAKGEGRVDNQLARNYDTLRGLKHKSDMETLKLAQDSEKQKKLIKESTEDALEKTAEHSNKELKQVQIKNFEALSAEQKNAFKMLNEVRATQNQEIQNLAANHDLKVTALHHDQLQREEELKDQTYKSIDVQKTAYEQKYENALTEHKKAVNFIDHEAKDQLENLRNSHQTKLAAFSDSRSDPFYRPMNINAKIEDRSDHFLVTAEIPPHERDKISVVIRGGNEIVIQGVRRADDRIETEPGRVQSTSSYQTFSQSFPLNWPVDAREMTREFDGDQLVIRVPKKAIYENPIKKPITVQKARLERPHFPSDLPDAAALAQKSATDVNEITVTDPKKKPANRILG